MVSLQSLKKLVEEHGDALKAPIRSFPVAGRTMDFDRNPMLMGVVNLSADSWYRESVCLSLEAAIQRGRVLAAQGASLIDLGAESTLPQAKRVDGAEQVLGVMPVLKALVDDDIAVSIETYLPEVAKACLEAGASVLNLTGCGSAESIYEMAAENGAAVIICYVDGEHVRDVGALDIADDPVPVMLDYFRREIERAARKGLERIFVDPGMGFYYKNLDDGRQRVRYQARTFLNTFRFRELGFPICHALPHAFETFGEEVRTAEGFFATLASLGGTHLFRTHEVPRVKAVLDTLGMMADPD